MKKVSKLPREQAANDEDGLPASGDVEAHGMQNGPDSYAPRLPGTGGDSLLPGMPGTGGDAIRRPVGTGDAGSQDDIEGTPAR